jgi:hypothetical protein
MKFTTNNKSKSQLKINCLNKQISTVPNIKFLGIYINDSITEKTILNIFFQNLVWPVMLRELSNPACPLKH